jgi:hypothetical protein
MPTTLLFIEILLTGFQSLFWLILIFTWINGSHLIAEYTITSLAEWSTPISLIGFGFLYLLGIIIDRLADWVFTVPDNRLRIKYSKNRSKSEIQRIRYKISKHLGISKHFDYNRSRTRIVRSGTVNFGISSIVIISRILFQGWNTDLAFILLTISILLTIGSYFSWKRLTITQFKNIEGLRKVLKKD